MTHWYVEREWTPWQQKLWHEYWYGAGDHPICPMLREAHNDYQRVMEPLRRRIDRLGFNAPFTAAVARRIDRQHAQIIRHINIHVGGPALAKHLGYMTPETNVVRGTERKAHGQAAMLRLFESLAIGDPHAVSSWQDVEDKHATWWGDGYWRLSDDRLLRVSYSSEAITERAMVVVKKGDSVLEEFTLNDTLANTFTLIPERVDRVRALVGVA